MVTLSPWRAREREPVMGIGAEPPAGSRGRAPGSGVEGRSLRERLLAFGYPKEAANLPYSLLYMLKTQ